MKGWAVFYKFKAITITTLVQPIILVLNRDESSEQLQNQVVLFFLHQTVKVY